MEVSDPRSPVYGKHLSVDEVKDVLALSPHNTYDVQFALAQYNVTSSSVNRYGDIISLEMNAKVRRSYIYLRLRAFANSFS